jgi:hypothetical protein
LNGSQAITFISLFKPIIMKYLAYLLLFSASLVAASCGNKGEHTEHDHQHDDANTDNPNNALYDEVMKIHDEVMPKMEDIYKMKEELKKQIAESPSMLDEKRKEIESKIAELEAASKGMMDWMHDFNPPADSLGEEVVREYLEGEMEKVKKVKEDIMQVLKASDL